MEDLWYRMSDAEQAEADRRAERDNWYLQRGEMPSPGTELSGSGASVIQQACPASAGNAPSIRVDRAFLRRSREHKEFRCDGAAAAVQTIGP
jgi:hypothetical protein